MTFVENIEMSRYSGRSIGESYDWKLIILYLFLVFIGWANIYASVHGADVEGIFDFSANSGKQYDDECHSSSGCSLLSGLARPSYFWSIPTFGKEAQHFST